MPVSIASVRPLAARVNPSKFHNLPRTVLGSTWVYGQTKDSNGALLPNCAVRLFRTADKAFIAEGSSDDRANYVFELAADPVTQYYVDVYKAGAPDVAGTTVNTLTGLASFVPA